jgi:hypothetical protein
MDVWLVQVFVIIYCNDDNERWIYISVRLRTFMSLVTLRFQSSIQVDTVSSLVVIVTVEQRARVHTRAVTSNTSK